MIWHPMAFIAGRCVSFLFLGKRFLNKSKIEEGKKAIHNKQSIELINGDLWCLFDIHIGRDLLLRDELWTNFRLCCICIYTSLSRQSNILIYTTSSMLWIYWKRISTGLDWKYFDNILIFLYIEYSYACRMLLSFNIDVKSPTIKSYVYDIRLGIDPFRLPKRNKYIEHTSIWRSTKKE